eukprot:TRINITY_DN859_c0_g1_i3.p1 TRINITY_DN859_c0_g1~~TRINITY_DN859_c0_g1_i3.p1  ORF type:complete len:383 (-),score=75.19 TRINITY_DN859_c0_g1_i3:368-1516(-)
MDFRSEILKQTGFTVELYGRLSEAEPSANVVVSPISVALTLAMVAAGARGPTLDQFYSSLKLPSGDALHEFASQVKSVLLTDASSSGGPSLVLANGVWVEKTLEVKPSFLEILKEKHQSFVQPSDFLNKAEDARREVNEWAEKETHGRIKDLLPPQTLNSDTRLVLANAIYFKGTWEQQFLPSETKDGTFYLLDGKSVPVRMMTSSKDQYVAHFYQDSYSALRLPYARGSDNRAFYMYILLPDETTGLPELEKKLTPSLIQRDLQTLTKGPVADFQLPRFKISAQFDVAKVLESLGLQLPFSREADFSNLADAPVSLSNVFHKAFVEVNEEGTEAAAASAAIMRFKSLPMRLSFVADHPFLFLIKEDQTDVALFIGKVTQPE